MRYAAAPMTKDLVEQLRHTAPILPVCGKAADEIERLRGIICWTLDAISGGSSLAEIEEVLRHV